MTRWNVVLAVPLAIAAGCTGSASEGDRSIADGGSGDDPGGEPGDGRSDAAPEGRPDASPPGSDPDAGAVASCHGLGDPPAGDLFTIQSGGMEREYRLHVPPSYDPAEPMPVVLNFHGLTSNAGQQEAYSGMSDQADEAGFIAVHPEGIAASWNGGGCCGDAAEMNVPDVEFVSDLLDHLETVLCVDPDRIHATGMSNGGFMSHRLACDLADRIAAVAPVAGTNADGSCEPSRPVSVMQFHGTADSVVPYEGAPQTVAAWVDRNDCSGDPEITYDQGAATCETYSGCRDGTEVVFCTITGAGHAWPGAFGSSADIDATAAMWDFFASKTL